MNSPCNWIDPTISIIIFIPFSSFSANEDKQCQTICSYVWMFMTHHCQQLHWSVKVNWKWPYEMISILLVLSAVVDILIRIILTDEQCSWHTKSVSIVITMAIENVPFQDWWLLMPFEVNFRKYIILNFYHQKKIKFKWKITLKCYCQQLNARNWGTKWPTAQ